MDLKNADENVYAKIASCYAIKQQKIDPTSPQFLRAFKLALDCQPPPATLISDLALTARVIGGDADKFDEGPANARYGYVYGMGRVLARALRAGEAFTLSLADWVLSDNRSLAGMCDSFKKPRSIIEYELRQKKVSPGADKYNLGIKVGLLLQQERMTQMN